MQRSTKFKGKPGDVMEYRNPSNRRLWYQGVLDRIGMSTGQPKYFMRKANGDSVPYDAKDIRRPRRAAQPKPPDATLPQAPRPRAAAQGRGQGTQLLPYHES